MAAALARRRAAREGLREYYDPRTGHGLGAPDFAWTSLILEMADPVTPATTSPASSHV